MDQKIITMRHSLILLVLLGLFFVQCSSNDDDDDQDMRCMELEQEALDALDQKLAALSAYVQNTSDPELCRNYKNALQNRINKLNEQLNAGCIPSALVPNTQQAIMEDQATIEGLSC